MGKNDHKRHTIEKIINITDELNPDDIEAGDFGDLQGLIEQRDDLNPDDVIIEEKKNTANRENER